MLVVAVHKSSYWASRRLEKERMAIDQVKRATATRARYEMSLYVTILELVDSHRSVRELSARYAHSIQYCWAALGAMWRIQAPSGLQLLVLPLS